MKTLVLFLAVVLFISCNKNKLGDCLEESSIKETSIYGTWLLKRAANTDDITFDTAVSCYENTGNIVTFTASNTFSWDRFSEGRLIFLCPQGTFKLGKDALESYIQFSDECDEGVNNQLRGFKHLYSFRNQYLVISPPCIGGCSFWYVRLR